jgi:hypothetical protein
MLPFGAIKVVPGVAARIVFAMFDVSDLAVYSDGA